MKPFHLAVITTLLLGCDKQTPQAAESPTPPPPPTVYVAGAAFSPDGKVLLTAYGIERVDKQLAMPKRLVLWEVESGKKVWTADAPENLFPIAFLVGNEAVLLRGQHSLQIWAVNKAEPLRTFAQDPSEDIYCAA